MKLSLRIAALLVAGAVVGGGVAHAQAQSAPTGTRLMHRDVESSDAVPWAGPNAAGQLHWSVPQGTCSTVFQASNDMVLGLCTKYVGTEQKHKNPLGLDVVVPSVVLFDPNTAQPLATLELRKASLLGGVYGYLDEQDEIVIAEGTDVLRIGHHFDHGRWHLTIEQRTPLGLPAGTPLAGLASDGAGRTWFVTKYSTIGVIDGSRIITRPLAQAPGGEIVANGLTGRPNGMSVLTSHSLNEVFYNGSSIELKWRRDYDRGSARKPGQLSWGSGTTPTVFGPGGRWQAIVDNADGSPNLIVLDSETGNDVCVMPAFTSGGPGTENSIMASGNTLWIPSTYGFVYPPNAVEGMARPMFAPFTGGLTRIDVKPDEGAGVTCERVWEKPRKIETLPILTEKDRMIWSLSTDPARLSVDLVGISADTGEEVARRQVGHLPGDLPLQLTGMITPDGAYWQGTLTRMIRVK